MDSRFLHLLESNIPPTPLEVVAIQAEVERLSSKSHPTQHDPELEATLGQYRGILSPIRQIPSEIWGEIFYFATPAVVSEWDKDNLVRLCRVCSTWYEAALHAHGLWANIHLAPLTEGEQYIYSNLVSWLARSRDLKKGLEYRSNVWEPEDEDEDEEDGPEPTEQGFCPCHIGGSCMWMEDPVVARLITEGPLLLHRVSFQRMYPRCIGNAMQSFQVAKSGSPSTRPWNQIQHLELKMSTGCWQGSWDSSSELPFRLIPPSVTSLVICLPRLRYAFETQMECDRAKIDITSSIIERLTSLVLTCDWGHLHIVTILQHCSNLETLHLEFGYQSFIDKLLSEFDDSDPIIRRVQVEGGIHLPKVHTLRLYDGRESPIMFLQWIKTPALRLLDLETGEIRREIQDKDVCPNWTDALDEFVARSGCARGIQDLRLAIIRQDGPTRRNYGGIFSERISAFLSSLTSLTHLTFDNLPIKFMLRVGSQNVDTSLQDPSKHDWFPQLQSLQILYCWDENQKFDSDQWLTFFRTRFRGRQSRCWIKVVTPRLWWGINLDQLHRTSDTLNAELMISLSFSLDSSYRRWGRGRKVDI